MNYYERHIGDYLKDTAHLSLLEHGVYTRLLDVYYTREGPIPQADAARLIGARSKEERAALTTVLADFFEPADGHYKQSRSDREVARFHDKQAKAKRSADARWSAQRTHSEGNANASAEHTFSGDATDMRTHSEGNANGMHRAPVPSNQTPDTREEKEKTPTPFQGTGSALVCGYCGVSQAEMDRGFELDHFVPKAAGGSDADENRVVACHTCNQIKGARIFQTIAEARAYIHDALWTKNRQRYIEPRRFCFGGLPPAGWNADAPKPASGFDPFAIDLPDWLARDLWQRWCKDRADRRKPITEEGARSQLRRLDEYRQNGQTPERVIEHAIASGHQGLYPPAPSKAPAPAIFEGAL